MTNRNMTRAELRRWYRDFLDALLEFPGPGYSPSLGHARAVLDGPGDHWLWYVQGVLSIQGIFTAEELNDHYPVATAEAA